MLIEQPEFTAGRFRLRVPPRRPSSLLKPPSNRQGRKSKTSKPSETPKQEPVQIVTKQTKEDQSRLDKLESRVSELESRQDKFERKFDERLDGVDSALRQLLQRSEPARPRDAGETPPLKFPKNS